MRRIILFFALLVFTAFNIQAQDVIINEFSQGQDGSKEWIEILVVTDGVDLRGWEIGDFDDDSYSGLITFTNHADFASVASGTIIVVFNIGDVDQPITDAGGEDTDLSDFSAMYASNNTTYVTESGGWPGSGHFANSDGDDIAALRNSSSVMVHDPSATVSNPGSGDALRFDGDALADLTVAGQWSDIDYDDATPGQPNGGDNTTWVNSLRIVNTEVTVNGSDPSSDSYQQGSINNVLYRIELVVTTASATLSDVDVSSGGTFDADDLTNFKLWYSTDNSFDSGSDVLLSTDNTNTGNGDALDFSGLSQVIPNGATDYLFITVDLDASATATNTVSVDISGAADLNVAFSGTGTPDVTESTISAANNHTILSSTSSASDVIETSSFTFSENIDYTADTDADVDASSVTVWSFDVRDGGGAADGDALSTILQDITLDITNSSALQKVALYNAAGDTEIQEQNAGASVAFTGMSGAGVTAADGGSVTILVKATFAASQTDNAVFSFTVSSVDADASGSTFAAADGGGASSTQSGDENKIEVDATKLAFSSGPPSVVSLDTDFSVEVTARDANDNTDLDETSSVTLTRSTGTGTLSSVLDADLTSSLSSGVVSWSDLQYNTAETFRITASASGLTSVESGDITASGATDWQIGDIAITGYQADGTDQFSFVLLRDILAGDSIFFTDNGWKSDNTFRTGEGTIKWVANAAMTYGTQVTVTTTPSTSNDGGFTEATVTESGDLNFSGSGDQLFAYTGDTPSGGSLDGFLAALQMDGAWGSDATNTSTSAKPSVFTDGVNSMAPTESDNGYFSACSLASDDADDMRTAIYNSTNWTFSDSEGYTGFPCDAGALPVELTDFTASVSGKNVVLSWETATEVNNYGFEVERKIEDGDWTNIAFVNGYGNSNSPKSYSYIDETTALTGTYYYRLKQLDFTGTFEYSYNVSVSVEAATEYALKQNFPNPFNPATQIEFSLPEANQVRLTIFNVLGETVSTLVNERMEAGKHTVEFDASELNSGVYFYRIESGNFTQVRKMLLVK